MKRPICKHGSKLTEDLKFVEQKKCFQFRVSKMGILHENFFIFEQYFKSDESIAAAIRNNRTKYGQNNKCINCLVKTDLLRVCQGARNVDPVT